MWTTYRITTDCIQLHFDLQLKSPRRDVVRIPQGENKTFQTAIGLQMSLRSEAAEDIPFRVQNHRQSVCVTVTSAGKFFCFETIAPAPPHKGKLLPPEFCDDLQKV
jgi:hypothetical protein